MKQLNEFQNLDDFLECRFSQTLGKALVNDTQECSWEELRVKIAAFIEAYKSIADITKTFLWCCTAIKKLILQWQFMPAY